MKKLCLVVTLAAMFSACAGSQAAEEAKPAPNHPTEPVAEEPAVESSSATEEQGN
jgi:PBP1b-binding outer membrane lipoprotein LpoB